MSRQRMNRQRMKWPSQVSSERCSMDGYRPQRHAEPLDAKQQERPGIGPTRDPDVRPVQGANVVSIVPALDWDREQLVPAVLGNRHRLVDSGAPADEKTLFCAIRHAGSTREPAGAHSLS